MNIRTPTFLIIGAARSGTTTLYHMLSQHPNLFLPPNKQPEPHFFLKSSEFNRGFPYYCEKYFGAAKGQKAVGEASTSYLYQQYVAPRIAARLPDVRLVVLLRDPIERAFSNYRRTVEAGLETLTFDRAVRTEAERLRALSGETAEIAPYAYIGRSLYYAQLTRYLQFFRRDQLLILFSDDLESAPQREAAKVFAFLDLDDGFIPQPPAEHLNAAPDGDDIPGGTREYLRQLFVDDVMGVEQLTGRDLSSWCDTRGGLLGSKS